MLESILDSADAVLFCDVSFDLDQVTCLNNNMICDSSWVQVEREQDHVTLSCQITFQVSLF